MVADTNGAGITEDLLERIAGRNRELGHFETPLGRTTRPVLE
jgi:hypothetical protein